VAPEQNRALGRYVAIWTTHPEEEWEDRPHKPKTSEGKQYNVWALSHILSQTAKNMLLGALIATAGLWILAMTVAMAYVTFRM
jgi:hypothetical protein